MLSSAEALGLNPDLQDIISLNLSRAVQLSVDIASHILSETKSSAPNTMGETFTTLEALEILPATVATQLRKAVGFRNIAVHNYEKINWLIVYAICTKQLDDFKYFSKAIVRYCEL